jgi:hypothetical protein
MAPGPRSAFSTPRSQTRPPGLLQLPWLALLLVWLGYLLLGWQLSSLHFAWEVGAWIVGLCLTTLCIWGGGAVFRQLRLGPRSITTMLILSATITIAAVSSAVFALMAIIVCSEILTRLEMYAKGFNSWQILSILTIIATIGLSSGWLAGHYWMPSNRFWFSEEILRAIRVAAV